MISLTAKLIKKEEFDRKRRELIVKFGEEAFNIAEVVTSRYVGPVDEYIFSRDFEAICHAAIMGIMLPTKDKRESKIKEILK
jgi:hypothetical protein